MPKYVLLLGPGTIAACRHWMSETLRPALSGRNLGSYLLATVLMESDDCYLRINTGNDCDSGHGSTTDGWTSIDGWGPGHEVIKVPLRSSEWARSGAVTLDQWARLGADAFTSPKYPKRHALNAIFSKPLPLP